MTSLHFLNRNSIRWIPVSIKDFLKLWDYGGVVCTKADTCRCIEVIPYKIACPNVCSDITNCVFSMIDSGKTRIYISCTSSILNGRSCQVETWNYIVLDFHFSRAFVVLWGIAEVVGVEEGFQVKICVVDEVCPTCHQYLYRGMLRKDNLWDKLGN